MAKRAFSEDIYKILEVTQDATPESIKVSYKRLALKLHPDHNFSDDATEAFQRLGRAYEILKDSSKRREYDLTYHTVKQSAPASRRAQAPYEAPYEAPQEKYGEEDDEEIRSLQTSIQERHDQWNMRNRFFKQKISEYESDIQILGLEIEKFDIAAAAAATEDTEDTPKKGWYVLRNLGLFAKRPQEDHADVEARKRMARDAREERRIARMVKENRLASRKADLIKQQELFTHEKKQKVLADYEDGRRIKMLREKNAAQEKAGRAHSSKEEKEKQEKEARAKREEGAENLKRQMDAEKVKRQKEAEEMHQKQEKQKPYEQRPSTPEESIRPCRHRVWLPKLNSRQECPECSDVSRYLLRCRECHIITCPACQSGLRWGPPTTGTPRGRSPDPRERSPRENSAGYR